MVETSEVTQEIDFMNISDSDARSIESSADLLWDLVEMPENVTPEQASASLLASAAVVQADDMERSVDCNPRKKSFVRTCISKKNKSPRTKQSR